MKKFLVIFMSILMVLGLVGCEEKIRVASEEEIKMVGEVMSVAEEAMGQKLPFKKGNVEITTLTPSATVNGTNVKVEEFNPETLKDGDKIVTTFALEFKYKNDSHNAKMVMSYTHPSTKDGKEQIFLDGRELVMALKKGLVF